MEVTPKKQLKELKWLLWEEHRQRLPLFTINLEKQDFFTIKTIHMHEFNINKH